MSTELEPTVGLLDVTTGEVLPATIENAGRVLQACRTMKQRVNDLVAEATSFLVAESQHQGTKTLRSGGTEIKLSGGAAIDYDAEVLRDCLREAGCPEDRIDQAIVAEISYKVNRSVLRQLAAANPDYAAAVELAAREVERPWRASVA